MTSPRLTPSVVTDDQKLAAAIDAEVLKDATDREHRQRIADLQAELRARVDDEAWQLYLKLDDAVGARIADLSLMVATWAFVQAQLDAGKGVGR